LGLRTSRGNDWSLTRKKKKIASRVHPTLVTQFLGAATQGERGRQKKRLRKWFFFLEMEHSPRLCITQRFITKFKISKYYNHGSAKVEIEKVVTTTLSK
jgi:hypothetical protein